MTIAMPGSSDSLRRLLPEFGSDMTNLEKLLVEPTEPAWPSPLDSVHEKASVSNKRFPGQPESSSN